MSYTNYARTRLTQKAYDNLISMRYPWHLTVNWNVPENNMNKIRQARQNLNSAKGNRNRRRTVVYTLYGKLSNAAILRMFDVKRKRLRMKALINHNKKSR